MERALVIGATGQVGAALVTALRRDGFAVTGTFYSQSRPGLSPLDLSDAAAVCSCVARINPSIIFVAHNNAGGVDWCEEHRDAAIDVHVEGTRRVLAAASAVKARVVFYSTDYVFDGTAGPYAEDAKPSPISVYGRAKRDAESLVSQHTPGSLIVRTTAVVSWDRASRNFAMTLWRTLSAGSTLRVPNDQWANPTLAEFLADASVRLVQQGAQGVINIAGKGRMVRSEMAMALARTMALDSTLVEPVPTAALGQKARRPLSAGFDLSRLSSALGTEPLDFSGLLERVERARRADR